MAKNWTLFPSASSIFPTSVCGTDSKWIDWRSVIQANAWIILSLQGSRWTSGWGGGSPFRCSWITSLTLIEPTEHLWRDLKIDGAWEDLMGRMGWTAQIQLCTACIDLSKKSWSYLQQWSLYKALDRVRTLSFAKERFQFWILNKYYLFLMHHYGIMCTFVPIYNWIFNMIKCIRGFEFCVKPL